MTKTLNNTLKDTRIDNNSAPEDVPCQQPVTVERTKLDYSQDKHMSSSSDNDSSTYSSKHGE